MAEIRITTVEVTGPTEKRDHPWNRYDKYRVPVRYTLEDGRTFETGKWFGRLRDAKAYAAQGTTHPTNLEAWFMDDGRFGGVVEHVRIGGVR